MPQDWTANLYEQSFVADTTLQDMEKMFASLHSCFSGTSSPSISPVDGTLYKNTIYKNWRGYNGSVWFGLMHGDASQKMWVYRNAAMDGWLVDSSVTDKVLSIKGGATYTAGAATAGSWSLAHTHTTDGHALTEAEMPAHSHLIKHVTGAGSTIQYVDVSETVDVTPSWLSGFTSSVGSGSSHGHGATGVAFDGATWRPAAAVGTLQYIDMT